jgi:hypothetical protein
MTVSKEHSIELNLQVSILTLAKTSLSWFPIVTIIMDRNILKRLICHVNASKKKTEKNIEVVIDPKE